MCMMQCLTRDQRSYSIKHLFWMTKNLKFFWNTLFIVVIQGHPALKWRAFLTVLESRLISLPQTPPPSSAFIATSSTNRQLFCLPHSASTSKASSSSLALSLCFFWGLDCKPTWLDTRLSGHSWMTFTKGYAILGELRVGPSGALCLYWHNEGRGLSGAGKEASWCHLSPVLHLSQHVSKL